MEQYIVSQISNPHLGDLCEFWGAYGLFLGVVEAKVVSFLQGLESSIIDISYYIEGDEMPRHSQLQCNGPLTRTYAKSDLQIVALYIERDIKTLPRLPGLADGLKVCSAFVDSVDY